MSVNTSIPRRILYSCCCGNNVGQLAATAATQLVLEGFAIAGSPIALVANITPPKAAIAGHADTIISVDGCNGECCKKVLQAAGILCSHSLVVTDLGIDITGGVKYLPEDLELVKDGIRAACAAYSNSAPLPGCWCSKGN